MHRSDAYSSTEGYDGSHNRMYAEWQNMNISPKEKDHSVAL